jgi:ATPase subunit of ABC transporter with duplicated ATPase domains
MVMAKTQIRSTLESQNAQREKKIAQLNDFIARFSAGTRSSQVTSRRKEVERLQTNELARSNIARPYIKFDQLRPSGKHVLEFKHITKLYGDTKSSTASPPTSCAAKRSASWAATAPARPPSQEPARQLSRPRRQGLHARLRHRLLGPRSPDRLLPPGRRRTIEHGLTVAEWLHRWKPDAHVEDIRGILGQMLFSGEEGDKQTKAFSGGEQARLAFCKLILTKPNILIFDEPTNHLDLEAINALNIALQRYEGTVLLVTHDHDLIDEVATRYGTLQRDGIEDFQGPYAEWKGKHN